MTLTQYQMVGLNWLALMHTQELNGILGDEMVGFYSVPYIASSNRSNSETLILRIHGYTVVKLCSWKISQEELRSRPFWAILLTFLCPFSKDVLRVVGQPGIFRDKGYMWVSCLDHSGGHCVLCVAAYMPTFTDPHL